MSRWWGVVVISLVGCSPTSPTPPPTPAEQRVIELVGCFSGLKGIKTPPVGFFEKIDLRDCDAPEWGNKCPAACRAPGVERVECWRDYVNGRADMKYPPLNAPEVAAHEVCHVALRTYSEPLAIACANELLTLGKCD